LPFFLQGELWLTLVSSILPAPIIFDPLSSPPLWGPQLCSPWFFFPQGGLSRYTRTCGLVAFVRFFLLAPFFLTVRCVGTPSKGSDWGFGLSPIFFFPGVFFSFFFKVFSSQVFFFLQARHCPECFCPFYNTVLCPGCRFFA